jgi:predicted small lipoprotein YifL
MTKTAFLSMLALVALLFVAACGSPTGQPEAEPTAVAVDASPAVVLATDTPLPPPPTPTRVPPTDTPTPLPAGVPPRKWT